MAPEYLTLDLPPVFSLDVRSEGGGWVEEAVYHRENFVRLDDGSYYTQRGETGTPLYLRCVERRVDLIECVHGDGRHVYRGRAIN